jgi:hypothetical protein
MAPNQNRIIFLFFFLFVGCMHSNAQIEPPKNILFVGNSYTYFWNLPQTVDLMIESQSMEMKAEQSTAGGASLGHHWRGERELNSIELIKKGKYDAVVLQDHSRRAIDHPDSLMYFGELFGNLIKENNAQIYLYMTWAREWDPYMQDNINANYIKLAEKINARIVPVGPAWERARTLRPNFPLYDDDESHPSALGTYLTACVFYAVLTGKSPIGLPNRLISQDINGQKLYITIQSTENAIFCQNVAEEIVRQIPD